MPYWRLFYHLVWATKDRAPLIDEVVATAVERSIRATCEELGVREFAICTMPDHVHLALSIPPRLALADVVGRIKGASSYAVNGSEHRPRQDRFSWQSEYGLLSSGEKALPNVIAYIQNQSTRHASNDEWAALERISDPNQPPSGGCRSVNPGF